MTPLSLQRLRAGLVVLSIIFLVAVTGYCLAGFTLIDSVYMVVITLSTVGYEEVQNISDSPGLKLFTILVIVFGVSTSLYIMGGLLQMMFEGEINRAVGLRRVTREIERLSGHIVICGFGRVGEILAKELERHKQQFVIIEGDEDRIKEATALGYLALAGDATEEDALRRAGVERASRLVTTLPRDADNVFITLTGRNINPKLMIIARGELPSTEKKLIQAGADRVVLPAAAGALRMAAMITRPAAIELIEVVSGRQLAGVEVDELTIPEGSPLAGTTISEVQARSRHGVLVVAFRGPDGTLEFNPGSDGIFQAGAGVIVMGRTEDIDRFRNEYKV
ncbi:MAG: NAD-binding protein [Candidatus Nealsonbacteria bacterium]|nr:NAD-binding protein [Candidatus Nealsonbacteria bacterium]